MNKQLIEQIEAIRQQILTDAPHPLGIYHMKYIDALSALSRAQCCIEQATY
jgi:hypothetical protein